MLNSYKLRYPWFHISVICLIDLLLVFFTVYGCYSLGLWQAWLVFGAAVTYEIRSSVILIKKILERASK